MMPAVGKPLTLAQWDPFNWLKRRSTPVIRSIPKWKVHLQCATGKLTDFSVSEDHLANVMMLVAKMDFGFDKPVTLITISLEQRKRGGG